ncbi:MAG: dhbB [Conexibacter sp.]|nr:dhbB [Conexibacter sp.]
MSLPRITPYPMPSASELPANRVAWRLEAGRCALLIHDMQEHFLGAFDRSAPPIPELLSNINALRERCAELDIPVFYSAQPGGQTLDQRGLLQDFWGDGIAAGPEAQAIVDELAPGEGDVLLTKWRYSAFVRTNLDAVLRARGRDQLLVVGIYGHIGCLMTACHAFMQEVQPFLVADAIADFSEADHRMALAWGAQRCAVVTTAASVLEDLVVRPSRGLSRARVAGDLLSVLADPPASLRGDTDLMDLGLDSIAVMGLLTTWREQGIAISFEDLAEVEPTLDTWWSVIEAATTTSTPA